MGNKYMFDMDGTICQFYAHPECLEEMYSGTYFKYLTPYENVFIAIKMLIERGNDVGIISACVTESSKYEKQFWLHYNLPEIDPENILLCDVGLNKAEEYKKMGGNLGKTMLIDDYTRNLMQWKDSGGIAVKMRNELNGTNGTWKAHSFWYTDTPEKIVEYLESVMHVQAARF